MTSNASDLCVELADPPPGSPREILASIHLCCNALSVSHSGDLLKDPLTDSEREELSWYLEEYWKWPYETFANRAERIERELLPDVGKRLYGALFESGQALKLVQRWRAESDVHHQISISSALPRALSLPWELLHDEQGFLALGEESVSVLRVLLPRGQMLTQPMVGFAPPLRVLLVTARPEDAGFVDPRVIAHELLEEMQGQINQGTVILEFLRPPTFEALKERLLDSANRPVHVLHFDGHGTRGGYLFFENKEGWSNPVAANALAKELQWGGVRLVMLTACQSSLGTADDIFSSVAAHLIENGVDAVGAMSATVLVTTAARYAEAFYRTFAAGWSAPVAQNRARLALLLRLTPFEGGASEDTLLKVTDIPEREWATLRPALEQAALLRAETIPTLRWPFLHFHPVLIPYLRGKRDADDLAGQERYAERYHVAAKFLVRMHDTSPQAASRLARCELPNLRRALGLLLAAGKLDDAAELAESIGIILSAFGQWREVNETQRRVAEAVNAVGTESSDTLTLARYLSAYASATTALKRGEVDAAYASFTALLLQVEALPAHQQLGWGSYEHFRVLEQVGKCLRDLTQPSLGEARLREALAVLAQVQPKQLDDQERARLRGEVLTYLGDVLRDQQKRPQARGAYEEALHIAKQNKNLPSLAVLQGQLGTLALIDNDYAEARKWYLTAVSTYQAMGDVPVTAWYQLGRVEQDAGNLPEAERYYRKCLAMEEQVGYWIGAAYDCNQLGRVASARSRPDEAINWYTRVLDYDQIPPNIEAAAYINLAGARLDKGQNTQEPREREVLLLEARRDAENALDIARRFSESTIETWKASNILANIAEVQADLEAAEEYRRD